MTLRLVKWVEVAGRGRIAVCDGSDEDLPAIGDEVFLSGVRYSVAGVECSWLLTYPPKRKWPIGIVVGRDVQTEQEF